MNRDPTAIRAAGIFSVGQTKRGNCHEAIDPFVCKRAGSRVHFGRGRGATGYSAGQAKDTKAAQAEKGKTTIKILLENDKIQVYEATFKPGDEGANVARPYRVIRVLTGGTILRTSADGKTEKIEWKTGEVKESGPDPAYTPKNVGKTTSTFTSWH